MHARVVEKALLAVKFSELGDVFCVVRADLGELLVDRNRLYGKAILGILVADSLEVVSGPIVVSCARVEIPYGIQDRQVLGIFLDDLFVFGDRVRKLAL